MCISIPNLDHLTPTGLIWAIANKYVVLTAGLDVEDTFVHRWNCDWIDNAADIILQQERETTRYAVDSEFAPNKKFWIFEVLQMLDCYVINSVISADDAHDVG